MGAHMYLTKNVISPSYPTLRVTQRNNESREVQPYGHQERFCAALLPSTATLGSGSSAAVLAAPTSPSLCGVRSSLSSLREVMATTTETAAARTWRPRHTARTRVDSSARWRAWNYWMSQSIEFSKNHTTTPLLQPLGPEMKHNPATKKTSAKNGTPTQPPTHLGVLGILRSPFHSLNDICQERTGQHGSLRLGDRCPANDGGQRAVDGNPYAPHHPR